MVLYWIISTLSKEWVWVSYLVDVWALNLAHVPEVVADEFAVVGGGAPDLVPALVREEAQLLPLQLHLLRVPGQHILKCAIFIF